MSIKVVVIFENSFEAFGFYTILCLKNGLISNRFKSSMSCCDPWNAASHKHPLLSAMITVCSILMWNPNKWHFKSSFQMHQLGSLPSVRWPIPVSISPVNAGIAIELSETYHLNGTNLDWGTQLSILISIMYSNHLIIISPSPDHWLLLPYWSQSKTKICKDFSRDFFIASSAVQFVAKVVDMVLLFAHSNEAINIKCLPWQWNLQS